MKGYDYFRDSWPQIVRGCYAHGGRMYLVEERRDVAGSVRYTMGRELTEQEALEFRGMTIEVTAGNRRESVGKRSVGE